ncbi:hypothetical protein GUJ93_ZPchr0011g27949 [Zizania palustris]|uniref:Uncharacterized protein n=1 Tax=Zizania palustris TaxID=103762 RepID=A0A8J5WJW4_ZIZPA|nr:hypothetical protein GUJ93_ZPchr0011g27949 [Zizania palustris]
MPPGYQERRGGRRAAAGTRGGGDGRPERAATGATAGGNQVHGGGEDGCDGGRRRYSMFNGIINSRHVRVQKSTQSSQSSGVSSIRRRSEKELAIIRLNEALRQQNEYYKQQNEYYKQRDEYYRQQVEYYAACIAQQQAILQQLAQRQGFDMSQFRPLPPLPPFGSLPTAQDEASSSNMNELHATTPRGDAQNSNLGGKEVIMGKALPAEGSAESSQRNSTDVALPNKG